MATLLFVALVAGPHFKVDRPDGWEVVGSTAIRLELQTEGVVFQVYAAEKTPTTLDALAKWWKPTMETHVKEIVSRETRKGKLDGADCLVHDVRMKTGRVTWIVARRGKMAYAVYVHRLTDDYDDEIKTLLGSVKLLAKPEAKPDPKTKPDPHAGKPVPKREELTFSYWRFRCVKPAGLAKATKFDASEKANSVVARFNAVEEQSRLMIRIYARRAKLDVKKQTDLRIKQFEERYKKRTKPVVDSKWKVALARKTRHVRLSALDGLKKIEEWYFADCRNGCGYEIQIYRSGPKTWDKPVAEFLTSFAPTRKSAKSRMEG